VTLAIAIWGAVLGTASIALQLMTAVRDRPHLAVDGNATITRGGPYEFAVKVANRGRRATTVVQVGLEVSGGVWQANITASGQQRIVPVIPVSDEGDVRLLQPGEVTSYEMTPHAVLFPIDSPLRPYAIDSHGHISWSRAQPFLRWFFDAGWRPVNAGTELSEPSARPLYVAPVAPVWHVWKPRSLRGSWRRWSDYRTGWRRKAMRTTLTPGEPPKQDPDIRG
jgi:hypothetical protein